jgi:5-methylcytosine-specific restriction endonuclease McrA
MSTPVLKRCTRCGEHKTLDSFPLCRGKPRARCKPCHVADAAGWAAKNSERVAAKQREWKYKNRPPAFMGPPLPEHIRLARHREASKRWREANPEKMKAARKAYHEANPHVMAEVCRRRQAKLLKATPAWANVQAMQAVYEEAKRLEAETGIPHEVDHVVPLQGRLVSGLHCETNLRVLPRSDNRRKGNRLIDVSGR